MEAAATKRGETGWPVWLVEKVLGFGSQGSGWSVAFHELTEIGRGKAMKTLEGREQHFVVNPLSDGKPVQFKADICDVLKLAGASDDSSCTVLGTLQHVDGLVLDTVQQ